MIDAGSADAFLALVPGGRWNIYSRGIINSLSILKESFYLSE